MGKIFIISALLMASAAQASTPFKNLDEIRRTLGFERLDSQNTNNNGKRKVTVAILDKGFEGLQAEIGKSLPTTTRYIRGPLAPPADMKIDHGLRMAQMVAGLYSKDAKRSEGLELRLYNVFGYSNFKAAIDDVVKRRVDVVLYSEVWEYGGNLDGRGFINAQVDRAVRAGALWINAAGNFGRTTFNSGIENVQDNWVRLPDQNNGLRLICKAPQNRKCPVRVVLSWNDFKDDPEEGTDKDLDLALMDDLMNVVQSSALRQSDDRKEERPGYSKYPREIVGAELNPGTYYIKVKNFSQNFGSRDRLRISVDGEGLEMPRADRNENLLTPADNREVITVGALDSDRSSRSQRLGKPDLMAPSSIVLANSEQNEFRGSSNSAAFAAAAAALAKRVDPMLNRERFLGMMRRFSWQNGQVSLQWLRFGPEQGRPCFQDGEWAQAPSYMKVLLSAGGRFVRTTAGWRIMMPYDPLLLRRDLRRQRADDMVAVTPEGIQLYPRSGQVPQGAVEVFQRPMEAGLCNQPDVMNGLVLGF